MNLDIKFLTKHKIFWLILLLTIFIIPQFLSNYFQNLFISILIIAYWGICWNIVGGICGQLSFGHAMFIGSGAYCSTLLYVGLGISPWLGIIPGAVIAGLEGFLLGFLSFRYNVRGVYFAFITFAFQEAFALLVGHLEFLGRNRGIVIRTIGQEFFKFQFISRIWYLYIVLLMLLGVLLISLKLIKTKMGYYFLAIRENEEAAKGAGIDTLKYKTYALAISAFLSAIGGTFYAQYLLYIDPPTLLTWRLTASVVFPVIVGGTGTIYGPILGAFILAPIGEITRLFIVTSIRGFNMIVYGVIVTLVMIYMPEGFVGLIRRLLKRIKLTK